jgi:transposase
MSRQHAVILAAEQRHELDRLVALRSASPFTLRRSRILLLADTGPGGDGYQTDRQIAQRVRCSSRTVARTRATLAARGLEATVHPAPRPGGPPRLLTPRQEEQILEMTLGAAPHGNACWTVRLLTGAVIERGLVPTISRETIRLVLKKGGVRHG